LRPAQRLVEVVDVGVEHGEVLVRLGTPERPFGSVQLGEREIVAAVALADGVVVGGGCELLGGVGADRFEHQQPRDAARPEHAHEQTLGDQTIKGVEVGSHDRLGCLHTGPAHEHRKPREALSLRIAEQIVTPVDRGAQRALASGRVAGPGAQRAKRCVQALGDLAGCEQTTAGGRELDRER
jgi:hypothetical protein